jgi:hypothetical protein
MNVALRRSIYRSRRSRCWPYPDERRAAAVVRHATEPYLVADQDTGVAPTRRFLNRGAAEPMIVRNGHPRPAPFVTTQSTLSHAFTNSGAVNVHAVTLRGRPKHQPSPNRATEQPVAVRPNRDSYARTACGVRKPGSACKARGSRAAPSLRTHRLERARGVRKASCITHAELVLEVEVELGETGMIDRCDLLDRRSSQLASGGSSSS